MDWRWNIYSFKGIIYFLTVLVCVSSNANTKINREMQEIHVGKVSLKVRLAKTSKERAQGLMGVKELGEMQGMLFVFEKERPLTFWMKNTLLPLSIGFFDGKGVLFEIQDMDPPKSVISLKLKSYKSKKPAKYALEVNQGWFARNKVTLGQKLSATKGQVPGLR